MSVQVGQVWEDTHITNSNYRWIVRVMKLNQKSARVERCYENGRLCGWGYQYRMEFPHFERGRMQLVKDVDSV
jgi:hypothetical protein